MVSRRTVLAAAVTTAASATAGCVYDHPAASSPTGCTAVSVEDLRFEDTDDGRAELVVTVTAETLPVPDLVGTVETCNGMKSVRAEITSEGTQTIRFGPYECVEGTSLSFDSCEG